MPQRTIRMIPPPTGSSYNPINIIDRSYGGTSPVDMIERDADIAGQHGWTKLGMIGTTAQRPTPLDVDFQNGVPGGLRYIDTTISAAIVFDAANKQWRHAVTGVSV